jgi:hypothetical protein
MTRAQRVHHVEWMCISWVGVGLVDFDGVDVAMIFTSIHPVLDPS